jgi:ParB family chromosome partitioning protein
MGQMIEHISKLLGMMEKQAVDEIKQLKTDVMVANPFQPRTLFDDEKIVELATSIQSHGIIQPIIVRKVDEKYEIIAGERRWRAARLCGLEVVPAIIRDLTDEQTATISLIENLQREGLTAIEEANAFQQLILLQNITQESLAMQLGKSQSSIANKLRLLNVSDEVKQALYNRQISERHARSLLKVEEQLQLKLLDEIIRKDLSVKQLDTRIKFLQEEQKIKQGTRKSFTKDVRLAINTVRQSVEMIKNNGLHVVVEESDEGEFVTFKIQIFKQK